ncbi:MAG: hypothetical protein ACRD18_06660 [Terriglobia bacterium]
MRIGQCCILVAILCACSDIALATSIPITGSFLDAPQAEWDVQLSGAGFSVATEYFIPFSRPLGTPPAGKTGTLALSVGMADYESPADGTPSDSGSLDGVEGIVEGEIDFQVTYNPSPPGDPTAYAGTISGVPVTFSGGATGYTCAPVLPAGCVPGAELWSVNLSGAGDATITQSSSGMVESAEVDVTAGAATFSDPPVPATDPPSLPFLVLAILTVFLLRRRYHGAV